MEYHKPKLFFDSIEKPYSIMRPIEGGFPIGEMSREDQATICALIVDNSPKKVLEVGVAAGGTTAVVMNCLSMNSDSEMYSVDLNTRYYKSPEKAETGYLYRQIEDQMDFGIRHTFLLGKSLPYWLEEIGRDIDFVILDTVHSMPGELLDFLCILPYLSENAIIVVHDVNLNLISREYSLFHQYATKVLLTTVSSSEKYYDLTDPKTNIAAFRVDNSTRSNILDVFSALTITWQYIPPMKDIKKYVEVYNSFYRDVVDSDWIKMLFFYQEKTIAKRFRNVSEELDYIKDAIAKSINLYLYGTGKKGQVLSKLLGENRVRGFVVSNDYEYDADVEMDILSIDDAAEKIDFLILAANSVDCYWNIIDYEIPHLVVSDVFWDYYHCL